MTSFKEITRPPDNEIRANIFIHHVRGVGMKIKNKWGFNEYFSLTLEKSLESMANRLFLLGEVLKDLDLDQTVLNELSPTVLADGLDSQTASRCVVQVYASCTSPDALREFLAEVLPIALKQKGRLDGNFMPLLSTDQNRDMITRLDSEAGESMFVADLYFTFE